MSLCSVHLMSTNVHCHNTTSTVLKYNLWMGKNSQKSVLLKAMRNVIALNVDTELCESCIGQTIYDIKASASHCSLYCYVVQFLKRCMAQLNDWIGWTLIFLCKLILELNTLMVPVLNKLNICVSLIFVHSGWRVWAHCAAVPQERL